MFFLALFIFIIEGNQKCHCASPYLLPYSYYIFWFVIQWRKYNESMLFFTGSVLYVSVQSLESNIIGKYIATFKFSWNKLNYFGININRKSSLFTFLFFRSLLHPYMRLSQKRYYIPKFSLKIWLVKQRGHIIVFMVTYS